MTTPRDLLDGSPRPVCHCLCVLVWVLGIGPLALAASTPGDETAKRSGRSEIPLVFVENCGQLDERARFATRTPGLEANFTAVGVELTLRGAEGLRTRIRMLPLGTRAGVEPRARDPRPGHVNVYRGRERLEGIATFSRVEYSGIYSGIDLVYSGDGSTLKADWVVHPSASVEQIRWCYEGARSVAIHDGLLRVETSMGELVEERPILFQDAPEGRRQIEGGFRCFGQAEIGFWVGEYDADLPLVIDPGLEWSTFLGGSLEDRGYAISVDAAGNVLVGGSTSSSDFPTTPSAFDQTFNGSTRDGFIAKLSPSGALLWATYLGGNDLDWIEAIALDAAGRAHFAAATGSTDFPTTVGAYDTTFNGPYSDCAVGALDAGGGTLVYSTFLGGENPDAPHALTIDSLGNVLVGGYTWSTGFPVTPGAFDTTLGGGWDGFVAKLDPTGSSLQFATYLGGDTSFATVFGIAVDSTDHVLVTGEAGGTDFPTTPGAFGSSGPGAFVSKLDPTGSALVYSGVLSGSSGGAGRGIALDAADQACVVGSTSSSDFPVTPGAFDGSHNGQADGFVTKINAAGSGLVFSTFLGGTQVERIEGIALAPGTDDLIVAGSTRSSDFPTTPGAFQTSTANNGVVAVLDSSGSSLLYSTALGGGGFEEIDSMAVDATGTVHVTGETKSPDYPVTSGAFDSTLGGASDAFVTQLRPGPVLRFLGTPAAGQTVQYVLEAAASVETGNLALVLLSCSGTGSTPLPGGAVLPLTFDACTQLGIQLGAILQGTIDASGQAATPQAAFPSARAGIRVTSAASTWNLSGGTFVRSVTPAIEFVTQ